MYSSILIIGTSVIWGQGLLEKDKIHTRVVSMLQQRNMLGDDCRVIMLAHSGALLGFKGDDTEDTKVQPRVHPEVPTFYPTVVQQLHEFDTLPDAPDPDSVDLILIEGGVNDVSLVRIFNPLVPSGHLEKATETHCYRHMKLLLQRVVTKFPKARVVVLGYYPYITEESEESFLTTFIHAVSLPGKLDDLVIKTFGELEKRKILENCDLFAVESTRYLQAAVDEVNRETKAPQTPRVLLALPNIQPKNAAFAPEPFLFGVDDDFHAQDPMADERHTACDEAGLVRTIIPACKVASAGHPNPDGAQAYADAIVAALERHPAHDFSYTYIPGSARDLVKDGIWFRDGEGRFALFRGMNFGVRSKFPPYLPVLPLDVTSLDGEAGIARLRQELDEIQPHLDCLKKLGINMIRIPVMWKALEPRPNPNLDKLLPEGRHYLDHLRQIIDLLYERGMFVLIDFHQDVAHELFGGDGFPDWALAIDDTHKRPAKPPAPSPKWMLRYYNTVITTLDQSVRHTLKSFWRNSLYNKELTETELNIYKAQEVRTHLEKTIAATARYFMELPDGPHPAIIGYEPFNEPQEAGIPADEFESQVLPEYYENVLHNIRAIGDDKSFLFMEPRVDWATYDADKGEFQGLNTTEHPYTLLDVERIADERTVFAFHFYDNNAYIKGEPSVFPPNIPHGDDMSRKAGEWPSFFRQIRNAGTSRRLIPFLTEFGGDQDWTFKTDLEPDIYHHSQIRAYMDLEFQQIEALLLNAAYWVYDLYNTKDGKDNWNDENASLLGPDRVPRNLDIVARVYPLRSSAEPYFLSFDLATKHGIITLHGTPVDSPTVIYIPVLFHYMTGFEVRATSPDLHWDSEHQLLYWKPSPADTEHQIIISPVHGFKQSAVPAIARELIAKTTYYAKFE